MSTPIESVRGMRDVLPDEYRTLARVRHQLTETLTSYGYAWLDLPIVEYRDLYLRKVGEELAGKLYEFTVSGRELALRPEWTASVLRAYVTHLHEQPLPLRLAYTGPVFRYERPQRRTYRQFTQLGVELIGAPAPRADAEVIALACAGLEAIGLRSYRITLGHIGVVRQLLTQLGLEERTQGILIWNLERLRTKGVAALRERLDELHISRTDDAALLAGMDDEHASRLLLHTMQEIEVSLSLGTRPPAEIVQRLVRKLRRGDPLPRIERALDLLVRLTALHGHPATVLPQVTALLEQEDLHTPALAELQALLSTLAEHGIDLARLTLDFGMGRGLHYYTGVIFELYDNDGYQLCGGGRYDDLVLALGGRQAVPAVGFAYGLERLVSELPAAVPAAPPHLLVIPVASEDYAYALEVARRARQVGYIAYVELRERSVAANLREAARRGITAVALVGSEERSTASLLWRDLSRREEQRVSLTGIPPAAAVRRPSQDEA